MDAVALPSPEIARELLNYDPETGLFTWKVRLGGPAKVGKVAGSVGADGYIRISVAGHRCLAHRLAFVMMTGEAPKHTVDHINRDRSDNRWCNLRDCTQAENNWNYPVVDYRQGSTSRYTGVSRVQRRHGVKWRASIKRHGTKHLLGLFCTEAEARDAYLAAKQRLHIIA